MRWRERIRGDNGVVVNFLCDKFLNKIRPPQNFTPQFSSKMNAVACIHYAPFWKSATELAITFTLVSNFIHSMFLLKKRQKTSFHFDESSLIYFIREREKYTNIYLSQCQVKTARETKTRPTSNKLIPFNLPHTLFASLFSQKYIYFLYV